MYCRKCGAKLQAEAKFCDQCQCEVISIQTEVVQKPLSDSEKKKADLLTTLKNPYVFPSLLTAIMAFGLGIFPWPVSWGIGTSLWMRILILLVALLANYLCTKARQLNRLYKLKYQLQIKASIASTATVLSSVTTVVALFALFMM